MNRTKTEEYISRSLDGELTEAENRELEKELEASPSLRELQQDLLALHGLEIEEPPPFPIQPPPALQMEVDRIYGPASARGFRRPRFNRWLLAVAILLLGFAAWWAYRPSPTVDASRENLAQIQREIQETRGRYHEAIGKMEEIAVKKLDNMPSDLAFAFADNLKNVNQAIYAAENLVDNYPENYLAYAALSRAYHAKVSLLEKILSV